MLSNYQKTIKKIIEFEGVGLHSGKHVNVILRPAPINTGIILRRIDCTPIVEFKALYKYVSSTSFCTSLQYQGIIINTVEHLLSALAGLEIDNIYIDINASEIPIMDGSAKAFIYFIKKAGICIQNAKKKFIRILKKIRVEDNDKYVQFLPYNGYKITMNIDFNYPVFDNMPKRIDFVFSTNAYIRYVCHARTFCLLSDYRKLKNNNLVKGGKLNNAIVISNNKILNKEGLRFNAECVTHKILDIIGDLNLLGFNIYGAFEGYKSGHNLNNLLLKKLVSCKDYWEYIN